MKPLPDDQLRGFVKKRIPSRDKIIDLQALALLHDDPFLMKLADDLLDIRQAVHGGRRDVKGSRHFPVS